MGHQDKGHYAQKHPCETLDPKLSKTIKAAASDGLLSCVSAHKAAKALGCKPGEIGIQSDLLELRISQCQLGLFGYSPDKKNLDPDIEIPANLNDAIFDTQDEGRISCRQCWDMAKACKVSRLEVGSACDKKEIRIKPCQLGAF